MVDYLKTSLNMRGSFPLETNDQRIFDDFDHVSNKACLQYTIITFTELYYNILL